MRQLSPDYLIGLEEIVDQDRYEEIAKDKSCVIYGFCRKDNETYWVYQTSSEQYSVSEENFFVFSFNAVENSVAKGQINRVEGDKLIDTFAALRAIRRLIGGDE